jgi:hypothetical protein
MHATHHAHCFLNVIVTCLWLDMGFLSIIWFIGHSQLQIIITLSLIYTLNKAPQHRLSVLNSLCLHMLSTMWIPLTTSMLNGSCPHWLVTDLQLIQLKVKVMLWTTVIRSVFLVVKHPSGAQEQIFITVRQLQVCWCGAFSHQRGWVCCSQFLLALASAVIVSACKL